MNRRTVLATGGTSLGLGLVGCFGAGETADPDSGTGGNDGDDATGNGGPESTTETGEGFERCHLVSITYESLPDAIRAEVDAALEDGPYATDDLLFDDAVDPDRSYVVIDETPYDPCVETDGDTRTLELEAVDAIRLPEPRVIRVSNDAEREHEVRVELTAADETIVDEIVSLDPDEERDLEATDEFGGYELTARAQTGHEATDEFDVRISDSHFDAAVSVTDDGIVATQSVADMLPCPWDARFD